jgi:hypothetical protein
MKALLGVVLALCAVPAARSDQLRIALVISNDEYGAQVGPSRCSVSTAAAGDALRGKGFKIIERVNLDRGEFESAIAALARRIAASPASIAVLYIAATPWSSTANRSYCPHRRQFPATTMFQSKAFLQKTWWRAWARPRRAGASSYWTYSGRQTLRRQDSVGSSSS